MYLPLLIIEYWKTMRGTANVLMYDTVLYKY